MRSVGLTVLPLFLPIIASPQATFSPAAGTYTGAQTVTVTCPAGLTCFYTTDGSTPSIAGFLYSAPITVASTQTIKVIAAQVGVLSRNSEASGTGWKCVTPTAHTYGAISCQAGGGVGTINPSNIVWTFGTPTVQTTSTTSTTGTTQILYVHSTSSTGCTNCNEIVQDKIVSVDKGSTFLLNNEMDANVNMLATYNQFHTASLQCNQQGTPQWQIDNQQGSWQNTGITFGCPLSTTQQTEIRYGIHWTNGDTACSGFSCDHYDFLTICVGGTNGTGGTCQNNTLAVTLPGFTEPTWAQSLIIQDQPDLTNTTTCGTSPCTATRRVLNNNVTLAHFGTEVTSSATYTIGAITGSPIKGHGKIAGTGVIQ